MNVFQELRTRRVPQITSGYVVGSWGLLQFLAFLEDRMRVTPDLVNLVGLSLLLLLPTVLTLAWVHGAPGRDEWGRAPKVVVPANVVAIAVLLFVMFQGRELGAVTRTIEVEDENGAITERVVPKGAFRQRLMIYYPVFAAGADSTDLTGETVAYLLSMDLAQDFFVDVALPYSMPNTMRDAGSDDGHGLPRALQRRISRDAHMGHFLTSEVVRGGGGWELHTVLHDSESGRVVAERTVVADDLYGLVDGASRLLREDLGVPAGHIEAHPDLPVVEMTSADPEAVRSLVRAVMLVTHANAWAEAEPLLEDAVARDERLAIAQFMLFAVRQTLGDAAGASEAIAVAMENLYQLPERLGFMIKTQYYYNEKQDAEKAVAVLEMWSRIYPDDVSAYEQLATFAVFRQDIPAAVAACERILEIDPSRVQYMNKLADLHTQLGELDTAEGYLRRYIEAFPTRADGYEDLSDFYSRIGRLDAAREALAEAQLLDPEDTELALSAVDLDIKAGLYDETSTQLDQMLADARTPRDRLQVLVRQMKLAGVRGRADETAQKLAAIHAAGLEIQNPVQANLVHSLMLPMLSMAGRPDEALVELAGARAALPEPLNQLVGVGEAWCYADLGRADEAATALAAATEVVEQFSFEAFRSSLALVDGMIAEARGDLPGAVALYREAVDLAPQVEPFYRVKLIRALRLSGETRAAEKELAAALKVEPKHPETMLEAAQLRLAAGDGAAARAHLDVALAAWTEASPEFMPAREARRLAAEMPAP